MSLFDGRLVAQSAGDFLLQTHNMAWRKTQGWAWMPKHIGIYMVGISLVVGAYVLIHHGPAWLFVAAWFFLAGTHILLDRREFTKGWMHLAGMSPKDSWLPIVADQVVHLLTLALVAQALVLVDS